MAAWKIALPLALGLASPGLAGASEQATGMAVSYADLDLSRQAGARQLRARVQRAVRTICAQPRQGVLASPSEIRCRQTATAKAQEQIERVVARAVSGQSLPQTRFAATLTR